MNPRFLAGLVAMASLSTIAATNPPAVYDSACKMGRLFPDPPPPPPRTPWRSDEEKLERARAKRARKSTKH